MNIYFSGIGGVGIGPLAEIAHDAGYSVTGSDLHESLVTAELRKKGIRVSIGQDGQFLHEQHATAPLDWFVYTSALPNDHPELILARQLGIRTAKRDELLAHILTEKQLKLIAIAGTHGKTSTTSMAVWIAKSLGIPVSYSIGSTLTWGPSGHYAPDSEYFIYECDEFDRNFLHFHPRIAVVTSIEHDHIDTFPTSESYMSAFRQFGAQSQQLITWRTFESVFADTPTVTYIDQSDDTLPLGGAHNRRNASLLLPVFERLGFSREQVTETLSVFPGANRRFERLADNLYTDYGHTPAEIAATLQMARELSDNVVLVYQPHQNRRQHEVKNQYTDTLFADAETVYWLPTYLSRENSSLRTLTPEELTQSMSNVTVAEPSETLWQTLQAARAQGKLILCMGAGDIDGWVRDMVKLDA